MSAIEFYNGTRQKVSAGVLVEAAEKALKKMRQTKSGLDIILVGETRIRTLNRLYRHQDKVTDVLSFEERGMDWKGMPADDKFLGDIFICIDRARSQAKKFGHGLNQELAILVAHGTLHLLGLTHKQMEDRGWGMGERI